MTYQEALRTVHSLRRFQKIPGFQSLRKLLHTLGDPQEKLRFLHVAGTNGKGSTSTLLAAMCQKAHYRTGLFVSPYVTDFCERIQLNFPSCVCPGRRRGAAGRPADGGKRGDPF